MFEFFYKVAMSYYDKHVFFCTNQRAPGEGCCNNSGASRLRDYAKNKVKTLALSTDDKVIRINAAGCMGRCVEGPVLVVYPEGVWYTYKDESDIDEIIETHLKNGRVVERLKI
jgi:(2Fe-2S) ferredoxin